MGTQFVGRARLLNLVVPAAVASVGTTCGGNCSPTSPCPAVSLALAAVPETQPGVTFSVEVTAYDKNRDVATDFAQGVTLRILDSRTSDTVLTRITQPASGVATFSGLSLMDVGSYRLHATADSLQSDTLPITVVPHSGNKTWVGGAPLDPTNWSNPANWLRPGVPSSTDTVSIPAGPTQPTLSSNAEVGQLLLESGASLNLNGFTLVVRGDLDAGNTITGSGLVRLTGVGAALQGTLPSLEIDGQISLDGNTVVFGNLNVANPGSELRLNGHPLAVTGDFTVVDGRLVLRGSADTLRVYGSLSDSGGTLVMEAPTALLDVGKNVRFTGATHDTLTAGVLRLGGDFTQLCGSVSCAGSFPASGTHRVVFDGHVQRVSFEDPSSSHFHDVQFDAADSVWFVSNAVIQGSALITGANVVTGGLADTISIGGDLQDTCGDGTCWQVVNTVFSGSPRLPGILATNVILTGQAMLQGNLVVSRSLTVSGIGAHLTLNDHSVAVDSDVVVHDGALDIGNGALSVQGGFTDTTGSLVMRGDADLLVVQGNVMFAGPTHDTLTAGALRLSGDFKEECVGVSCAGTFPATGSHMVVFEGPGLQRISFTTPTLSRFYDAEFSNASEVRFITNASIAGSARITGDNIVTSLPEDTVTICGSLVDPGGDWRVAHTVPCARPVAFASVSAGSYHTCGLTTDSLAYCWGDGSSGQLGNGRSGQFYRDSVPQPVSGGYRFTDISAGSDFSCAVTSGREAYCWGGNGHGQLGDGSTSAHSTPVLVAGSHVFVSVGAGFDHACGVTADSAAYCWGDGNVGQLGDGSTTIYSDTPVLVVGGHHFGQASAGGSHSCGVASGGIAYCWGTNTYGELGDGLPHGSDSVPSPVAGGHTFVLVAAGGGHSCGLTTGGDAYCWGHDEWGQVGDGMANSFEPAPQLVTGNSKFTLVSASHGVHSCGIGVDSAGSCWGSNSTGQLGNGSHDTSLHPTPEPVVGGRHFKSVSGGFGHTCAVATGPEDGVAFCWGANLSGQLGDNSTTERDAPVRVVAPSAAVISLGAIRSH